MRNMVRIIVGTLIDVARGQKEISEVESMIKNPCKSTRRYNISPSGLYLVKIKNKEIQYSNSSLIFLKIN